MHRRWARQLIALPAAAMLLLAGVVDAQAASPPQSVTGWVRHNATVLDTVDPAPVRAGTATFHHSKTPHMTGPNVTSRWRKVLTQHLREAGVPGEGGHYPWKVTVRQFSAGLGAQPESRGRP